MCTILFALPFTCYFNQTVIAFCFAIFFFYFNDLYATLPSQKKLSDPSFLLCSVNCNATG